MTMKKFFLTVAICVVAAASVNAQVVKGAEAQTLRGPYETNRLFDNVFIGAAGGVNLYQGENDHEIDFFKERLAPAVQGYIGKWVTPSVGIRLGYYGIKANGWFQSTALLPNNGYTDAPGSGKQKMGMNYVRGDLMWNISNAIGGYRADRFWDIAPYLGAGVMWNKKVGGKHDTELAVSAGIYNMFRISKSLDITLDVTQNVVNQRFDGDARARRREFVASAALGLAYQFKNREFSRAHAPVDVTPYNNKIKDLNKLLEDANALNKKLQSDLDAEKAKKKGGETVYVPGETKVVPSPFAVYFPLGKSTLTDAQKNSIKYFVETSMASNKDRVFEIDGAADSATGSAATNQKLGQARLDAVLNVIKSCGGNYKMSEKNLGGTMEFSQTDKTLNRVVVIK